jgi:hypothetical protein
MGRKNKKAPSIASGALGAMQLQNYRMRFPDGPLFFVVVVVVTLMKKIRLDCINLR